MVTAPRPQFVLASASKGRRQLLVGAGIPPFVCPSNFDEDQVAVTDPPSYVTTLARCKAESVAPHFPRSLVRGCDSGMAFGGKIYGKPKSKDDAVTRVYFADVDDDTIVAYVNSGEPLACAGAFSIDGKGGLLIEKIEGCHTNVIGLSLPLLRSMLEQLGYRVTEFW